MCRATTAAAPYQCVTHATAPCHPPHCSAAEWQLEGEGPWDLGPDVQLIFTPGHTAGCVSLLYKADRALFTGDHLAYTHRLGRLTIFRSCSYLRLGGRCIPAGPCCSPTSGVTVHSLRSSLCCLLLILTAAQKERARITRNATRTKPMCLLRLCCCRRYNWYSVEQQLQSVHKLLQYDFLHVLPGHGRRASFLDAVQREQELLALLQAEGWEACAPPAS